MSVHSELVTGVQDFTPIRRPSRSRSRSRSPSFKAAPSAYDDDDENYSIDSIYGYRIPVTYRKGPPDRKESSYMMDLMMENMIKNDYQRKRAERASNSVERYRKPKPTLLQKGKPLGFSGEIIKPPGTSFGKILRRAVKRSSKSAVLKQLAAFNRKNKKHNKKCFLYVRYIKHNLQ